KRIASAVNGFSDRLAVAEFHGPADGEQGEDETAEAIRPIIEAVTRGLFGGNAKHHGSEKGKQDSGFEMGKIHTRHSSLLFAAISKASTMARMFSSPAVTRNLVP